MDNLNGVNMLPEPRNNINELIIPPEPCNNINELIMPPEPPNILSPEQLAKGKFNYLKSEGDKQMLESAYKAITNLELWDFVKQQCDTFMFSEDKRVMAIYNKIEEIGYTGHSGFSFGWTMRQMQSIARYGELEYMNSYLSN